MSANGHKRVSTSDLVTLIEQRTGRTGWKAGREIVLLCPFHESEGSTPSLNVREGDGGYPLIRCRSRGCTPEQVLDSLGLSWVDVFGDDSEHWTPSGEPWVACYDYTDAAGTLLFQVVRTAAKDFSQRQPDPAKPHGWAWNLRGVERVPFHLPQVVEAIVAGEPVYVVDGEKDALSLEAHGVTATCCNGGMLKWPSSHSRFFAGANIRLVVDQDPQYGSGGKVHAEGQRAALQVLRMLAPTASSVTLLAPKHGKDATNHLEAGFGIEDFDPVDPVDLAAWIPYEDAPADTDSASAVDETAAAPGGARLRFVGGREFVAQVLYGLDPLVGTAEDGLLLPGSLMLLAGIGGSGKTTMSLHMLAHWAAGLPWFGFEVPRPLRCLVIENEGPHDPFVNKVKAFADRFKNCTCCGEPHGNEGAFLDQCMFMDAPWGHFSFDDPGLGAELHAVVMDFNADLVVANPLGRLGMKGAGTPEETRDFMNLLSAAGQGEDFAALILHHMGKTAGNTQTPGVQKVSGDWGPHPDTMLLMESAGERRSKLIFEKVRWGDQGKSPLILNWNVDPDGPVGYTLSDQPAAATDDEMLTRVDEYLGRQTQPSGITAITKGVKGRSKRISEIVEAGAAAGHYGSSGGARPTYWLASSDRGYQEGLDVEGA